LVFVPLAVYSYGNGKRLARRLVPTAVQFIGHTLLPVDLLAGAANCSLTVLWWSKTKTKVLAPPGFDPGTFGL
jgi:hypothetical protein